MQDGSFDLDFDGKTMDLKTTDSLLNAVAVSIGSYARNRNLKPNSVVLEPQFCGWWADAVDPVGTLGGYIYEAFPGKLDAGTADKLKTLAKEALEWMVEDGIAKTIECDVNIIDDKLFGGKTAVIEVVINKPDGEYENYNFEINWKAINGI